MFPGANSASNHPLTSGAFVQHSPLSSLPHDPIISLASHCIRQAFGPTVQLIADALQSRGGETTLRQLQSYIQRKTPVTPVRLGASRGSNQSGTDLASIRASLLVLIQHSLVSVNVSRISSADSSTTITTAIPLTYSYSYHPKRACWLQRYARYLEYIQKAADLTAAGVVETLLLAGKLRTVEVVALTVAEQADDLPKSEKYTLRQTVVEAFLKLVQGGFLEQVRPFDIPAVDVDNDDGEAEFGEANTKPARPTKRVKIELPETAAAAVAMYEHPAVVTLLQSQGNYKATLPLDAVWRVNHAMFHDTLRAFCLGRLVSERYGTKVQSAGSLVTAALKFRAHQEHAGGNSDDDINDAANLQRNPEWKCQFRSDDIKQWLPKPVLQNLEKKAGGVDLNLSKAWQALLELEKPVVVRRIGTDQYEIAVGALRGCLRERVVHQMVHDRHGEVAARMLSILGKQGWLESDALAVQAMVPAKDTREFLHQLYRSHYIEIFHVTTSKQHNPAATMYLWRIHNVRLLRQVTENVAQALWNIRLRREHEVEVGKGWIERAQQEADIDENEQESDRLNFEKFRLGLERLDCAAQQLDETLMVLQDF